MYIKLCLFVLRLILQAKGLYLENTDFIEEKPLRGDRPFLDGSWIQARCIVVECLLQVLFHFYVESALYHFVPWLD